MRRKHRYRKNRREVTINLPRSAPIQIKPFPGIRRLCRHWEKKGYRTVIDIGCGKLRNALVFVKHFKLWIVDFEETLSGATVEKRLNRLKSEKNFLGFIPANDFAASRKNADAAVIAYVVHTLPTEKLRRTLIRSAVRNTREPHELFVAVPNGEHYYRQRMGAENQLGDGHFFDAGGGESTFYREYSVQEIDEFIRKLGYVVDENFYADKKNQRTYVIGD
jgi:hypothetical protein